MTTPPRFRFADFLQLMLVVGLAAALRIGYLHAAADDGRIAPTFVVQGDDGHVGNSGRAPLAENDAVTAHAAPGYPWLLTQFTRIQDSPDALIRWTQCGLGALTAAFLFLFARRAFDSSVVALVAGVLAAIHPFWIVNTAELADGVVTTFLLAAVLALGARGSQSGGAFTSLLFGLGLAGLAMVRAVLLPFAVVALLWFLYQCRHVRHGWFNAVLAFLGFANGLAPWAVRNWQRFGEPVPVVDTAYVHLWIGNNPNANGGPMDEAGLRKSLPPERLQELLDEPNQAKRYARLGKDAFAEIARDPAATATRRWQSGLKFLLGDQWFRTQHMARESPAPDGRDMPPSPSWLVTDIETALQGSLLFLMIFGVLGWRWSFAWKSRVRVATLALLWAPLPYLFSHAEDLSGPRVPWDAALICFAAYALAALVPAVGERSEET